ncbi:MAG: type II toxin-antitoxin system RelE/ParE family toxin [Kiloniellales bacterium]
MASYKLVIKQSVAKDLRRIPKRNVGRILKRIETLADIPRPPRCEKLSARERYRIRQGVYRIVYSVEDEGLCVTIAKVSHRRDVYHPS